ncbi:hypothetical protein MTR67_005694 [Solanum verrucosum]|uniref:Uncharacterized protein n=1 Tax=Solanum verrucosum TaxID=315347 RepID=A0AAF0TBL4_SOLVR|nr:hypothetical protein MTR67_005694 [Solanum verrucosum]
MSWLSQFAGCDVLACAVCPVSIILFLALKRLVTYRFVFNMNSSKPWLLGTLLCVDEMFSGSGLYQLFLSTSLLGKDSVSYYSYSYYSLTSEILTNNVVLLLMVAFVVIPIVYCNINIVHKVVHATKGIRFFLQGSMILAHLCDEPYGLKTNMCMCLLCLPFVVANALTARLNDGVPMVDEFWVLLAYTAYSG